MSELAQKHLTLSEHGWNRLNQLRAVSSGTRLFWTLLAQKEVLLERLCLGSRTGHACRRSSRNGRP
eukprot:5830387-Alexandrium_andersonii.AAC.1